MATPKDKLIASAQKLVEKGQFERAIKDYLKVVQQDDKDVRIWLKIGDLYAKIGKKPEAAETYQRVAEFYSEQGFYLKAVAVYKQILKIEPRLVEVNQRLAELYKQLGLLSDAMGQYEAIAAFWHKEGKTREALAALKQIVELDPETVANRIKLAELYSKEGMAREAIDEFTKAAEQLKAQGRTDDYLKVAERLLFHSPDNRPVSKELARLYIEKGDPRRALPKLQVCFKADPRDVDVLGLLAKAFEALDQRAKAVSVLKELARILNENGDRQARDEVHRKILVLQPGDPDAEAALGAAPRRAGSGAGRPDPDRPPTGPGVPPRPAPLGASWPPPQVVQDPPPDEFDDLPAAPAGGEPRRALRQPQTTVGAMLDASAPQRPQADAGEEIARILNETDVYIKYKLYAKAIEHVQRVFEHDPRHGEAREKLKALYLTVGKREEAILELWALAEQAEPGRQRRYLREIMELDPSNARAAAMLGEQPAPPPPRREAEEDSVDLDDVEELADDEFEVAEHSSQYPRFEAPDSGRDRFGDSEEIEPALAEPSIEGDDDLIPLVVDSGVDRQAEEGAEEDDDRFGLADEEPVDRFGLGDSAGEEDRFGGEESATPAGDADEILGEDPNEVHTRFEDPSKYLAQAAAMFGTDEVDESELPSIEDLKPRRATQGTATVPSAALSDGFEETPPPRGPTTRRVPEPEPARLLDDRPETSLEDDLDEADFFVQQCLFDEARAILEALLARHPSHPLVSAKLRDMAALEAAVRNEGAPLGELGATPAAAIQADLSAELPDDLPGTSDPSGGTATDSIVDEPVYEMTKNVIEKGVTAEDYETHYDLGIAYKEMGLLDDAIAEFKLVMKDPTREVQCHLMIGLCCLEKGLQTEAIGHFKKGLYVEGITDRETLSLYFELGQAYEKLGDPREALYYYEKVLKRDPRFRNIEQVVAALRAGGSSQIQAPAPKADDVDAAFDALTGSGDS